MDAPQLTFLIATSTVSFMTWKATSMRTGFVIVVAQLLTRFMTNDVFVAGSRCMALGALI
jgi:hypothetical protein